MHEGYGLVCHRAIKACCEAIGIKDIHVKVEGSMNLQHIIKAFFIGLLQQVCILYLFNVKRMSNVLTICTVIRDIERNKRSKLLIFRYGYNVL